MMKKIIFLLFSFIFIALPSKAAWLFDGTSAYVVQSDSGSIGTLVYPDSNWSVGGWARIENLGSGSGADDTRTFIGENNDDFEYVLIFVQKLDTFQATSIRIFLLGSGFADFNNSNNVFSGNTEWTNVLLERSGTTYTVYADGVNILSGSSSSVGSINPGAGQGMLFGKRFSSVGPELLDGDLAEWAKWNKALTSAERGALNQGYAPSCIPHGLVGEGWYTPMLSGRYQEVNSGLTVANNGTTGTTHPRIIYCE